MLQLDFVRSNRQGWSMVVIAFALNGISFGTLSSVGVFLKPLVNEFAWSRGELSLGYTAITLATGLSGIIWSILADRYGARWIALMGSTVLGVPLLLLSQMKTIEEFYLYYFIFGAFGHAAVTGPLYANVGLWFNRNVGLALGCTFAGSAVGQGVVPVIARYLIENYGWQTAYTYLGFSYMLLAIPIALLVRDPNFNKNPVSTSFTEEGSRKTFPLSPVVVVSWISLAVLFCCTTMSVVVVHLVPLLTDQGMSPKDAVQIFFILMIFGAFGRILGGKLSDMMGALKSYALMSLVQTIVVFLFPHLQHPIIIYLIAIIFGVAFSGVMASFLVCVRMMVPSHVLARSMAVVGLFGWIGMGLGGWQGGVMFDLTGNYVWSFTNGSIAGVVNLLILFSFFKIIQKHERR